MKKFMLSVSMGLLALVLGFVPDQQAMAQSNGQKTVEPHPAANHVSGLKNELNLEMERAVILDSMLLDTARSPLGVTVIDTVIYISSSDGNGNNYFDTYTFSGKHLASAKQLSVTKWGYRDLAFDGKYILGSEGQDIKKISPGNFKIADSVLNKGNSIHRGLAYDAAGKAIYSSNWGSTGHLLKIDDGNGDTLKDYGWGKDAYGLAFDNWSQSKTPFLWMTAPSITGTLRLMRLDTANGKINHVIDLSKQVRPKCYPAGLEIIHNAKRFPKKTVALVIDQHNDRLYFVDLTYAGYELPLSMTSVGSFGGFSNGFLFSSMVKVGDYLYAVNHGALAIFDVKSDPTKPVLKFTTDPFDAKKIYYYNNKLYVGSSSDVDQMLSVFSLANPEVPQMVSGIATEGSITGMAFYGNTVFATEYRSPALEVFDFSDLNKPKQIAKYDDLIPGRAIAIDTAAKTLFVSFWDDGARKGSLARFDISDLPKLKRTDDDYTSDEYLQLRPLPAKKELMILKNWSFRPVAFLQIDSYRGDSLWYEKSYALIEKGIASYFDVIDSVLLVSFPDHGLQTFVIDGEADELLEGPKLNETEAGPFVKFPAPASPVRDKSATAAQGFTKDYLLYVINGTPTPDGGVAGSEPVDIVRVNAPPKPSSKVTLQMKIKPASAGFDGCATQPSVGFHQYAKNTTVSLKASEAPDKGWYFKEWSGNVSGTSKTTAIVMDDNKTVTANFINLSLFISGSQKKRIICPDSVKEYQLKMLPFTLTASDADDWEVTAVQVTPSGNGNDLTDVKKVRVYKGGDMLGWSAFTADNGKVSVKFDHPLTVPAGSSVALDVRYFFRYDSLAKHAADSVPGFLVSVTNVTAKPKNHDAGAITGGAHADTLLVARVFNKNKNLGFSKIQMAVKSPATKNGDTIMVCAGTYPEHIYLTKDLALVSCRGAARTVIYTPKDNLAAFEIIDANTGSFLIQGFTIGKKDVHEGMSSVRVQGKKGNWKVKNNIFGGYNQDLEVLENENEGDTVHIDSNDFKYSKLDFSQEGRKYGYVSIDGNSFDKKDSILLPSTKLFDFSHNAFYEKTAVVFPGFDSLNAGHNIGTEKCFMYAAKGGSNLYFHDNTNINLELSYIENSLIEKNKYFFLDINGASYINIRNNQFENLPNQTAIYISSGSHNEITQNTFSNCKTAIDITISEYDNIGNNWFSKCNEGIDLYNTTNEYIFGNRIYSNISGGIDVNQSKKLIIRKNSIIGNTYGIWLKNSAKCDINANHINKNRGRVEVENGKIVNSAGVVVINSDYVSLYNNSMVANCTAVALKNSSHTRMWGNNIQNSFCIYTGIHIENSSPGIFGNAIKGNRGYGVSADLGAKPVLHNNNLSGNSAGGLLNLDAGVKIDARNNWWGSNSGPSGTDVTGNVDASGWQGAPTGMESSTPVSVMYVPKGSVDSAFFFYTDLEKGSVEMNMTPSDDKGWLQSTASVSEKATDSTGIVFPVKFTVPGNTSDGTTDRIVVAASPSAKSGVKFSDTVTMYAYTPVMQDITLQPDSVTILKKDSLQFAAIGKDQHDRNIEITPVWEAKSGSIDTTGKFHAGAVTGPVTITVTDKNSGKTAMATVYVADSAARLKTITLSIDTVRLQPGQSWVFQAKGHNQYGFPCALRLKWSATGGTVINGFYRADSVPGTFKVTATDTVAGLAKEATVIIENATGIATPAIGNEGLVLSQNYPNPFQTKTQISFTLPKAATVWLSVFDMTGREVTRLVNAKKPAGHYTVVFHASGLPAGTYFYRLQAGGSIQLKKMILLK
jgi:parallel beta-helix repeat protein